MQFLKIETIGHGYVDMAHKVWSKEKPNVEHPKFFGNITLHLSINQRNTLKLDSKNT
jgi:hypothetical protein